MPAPIHPAKKIPLLLLAASAMYFFGSGAIASGYDRIADFGFLAPAARHDTTRMRIPLNEVSMSLVCTSSM